MLESVPTQAYTSLNSTLHFRLGYRTQLNRWNRLFASSDACQVDDRRTVEKGQQYTGVELRKLRRACILRALNITWIEVGRV